MHAAPAWPPDLLLSPADSACAVSIATAWPTGQDRACWRLADFLTAVRSEGRRLTQSFARSRGLAGKITNAICARPAGGRAQPDSAVSKLAADGVFWAQAAHGTTGNADVVETDSRQTVLATQTTLEEAGALCGNASAEAAIGVAMEILTVVIRHAGRYAGRLETVAALGTIGMLDARDLTASFRSAAGAVAAFEGILAIRGDGARPKADVFVECLPTGCTGTAG